MHLLLCYYYYKKAELIEMSFKWQKVWINTCGHKYVKIDTNINTVAIIKNCVLLKHQKYIEITKIFQIKFKKSLNLKFIFLV